MMPSSVKFLVSQTTDPKCGNRQPRRYARSFYAIIHHTRMTNDREKLDQQWRSFRISEIIEVILKLDGAADEIGSIVCPGFQTDRRRIETGENGLIPTMKRLNTGALSD
jgi:hypothetical protein